MNAFDLKLAEMLASRLCHDLVNPVGAVANGVELLSEFCDTMQKDALDLVASSADSAMRRISFFRVAYGFAGHDEGQSIQEVRSLAQGFLAGSKVKLDWPARPEDGAAGLPRSGLKLLLATIAFGVECLPRGGTLSVAVDEPTGAAVVASGAGARLESSAAAIAGAFGNGGTPGTDSLDPKSVGIAYVGRLAQSIGAKIAADPAPDRIALTLRLAA